jgi:quercetin dioxygenase-like cupin family protein
MNAVRWLAMICPIAFAVGMPATASATGGSGVTVETLSQATLNGNDYITKQITIDPGGSTGWHWHAGRVFGVIKEGTMTHTMADCTVDGVFNAGDPVTEGSGPNNVHVGRNLGPGPLVMQVVYIDPAGGPLSQDVPDPGCGFA